MKYTLYIVSIMLFFASCKSSSSIITTKEQALKKGIYTQPTTLNNTSKVKKVQKEYINKQAEKKSYKKEHVVLNNQNENDIFISENEDSNYLIEQLIHSASDNLGVGYRGGGITKDGFDCSGLMYSTFKKFDIILPRSSHEMAEIGTQVALEKAKKGDLIFFINRGQKRINHVGMIVDIIGDDVRFIHSSTQSGVIVSSLKESYYSRTFKQINRVIQ